MPEPLPSVPVASDEPANSVLQSTFYNQIQRDNNRLGVLEKGGVLQTAGIIVQTVVNGDDTHAPSGDAVFDFVADQIEATILTAVANLDFPNVLGFGTQTLTVTVTGAATGDAVVLGPPSGINAGLLWNGWVSAADTVSVKVYNLTAVAIDPPAADWRATVLKS